jgi:hypothetical protein
MSEPMRRCETCAWWKQQAGYPGYDYGNCHRHPPTLHVIVKDNCRRDCEAFWPNVSRRDFCGEHTPTTEQAHD